MYKSKLIHLLSCFSSEEKEAFRKWVYSPAHNQRQDRTKLFDYLLSRRKLTPITTNRHKVYELVYEQENYSDQKFKKLMNLGVQLVEDFIHFSAHKKDVLSKKKALILFAQKHQLHQYAQQYTQKAQQELAKTTTQNHSFFYQTFQLEQLIFDSKTTDSDRSQTNLQHLIDHQHIYMVLKTLRLACEAITHQRLYKSSYKIPLLEAILEDVASNGYTDFPAVQLYYYSYLALSQPSQEHYFKQLKKLLNQHPNVVPQQELKSIYLIAINYCVQQLNNGNETYVREVFELYKYGLDRAILLEHNLLSRFTYKNIVAAAIRLEEYDWVEQFLEQYTPFLELEHSDNYAAYARAKLAFAKKQFGQALNILTQVEFDNIFLNMDAKVMLLKIYYEQNDFDALDALLVAFRRFLQRKSILAYQRQIHENMINLTTKLLNTPIASKAQRTLLQQEIEQTNPLTERVWLLTQLHQS